MAFPLRQRTALESPQLATMILSGVTIATTAVDPTASQSGDWSSHLQFATTTSSLFRATTSLSILRKTLFIVRSHRDAVSASVSAAPAASSISSLSNSSFTSSCSRSLHLIAT
uniref:Uncharacterized protein n=1 Tax=Cucumis melo TaxID=3656 RepID=A0A9I9ELA3_CUCME